MNKIIKLLSIIVLSVISQIGIASAPAQQPLVNPLILDLKDILEKHYNEYSSSLKMDTEIMLPQGKEYDKYQKIMLKLGKIVDDLASHNDINTLTDRDGNTLLILAARYNCYNLAKYLIMEAKFNNFNAKNKYNFTAYDYVRLPSSQLDKFDVAKDFFKVENGQLVELKYKPVIVPNERFASLLRQALEMIENKQNISEDELRDLTQFSEIELKRKRHAAAIAQAQEDVQEVAQEKINQENNYKFKSQIEQIQAERAKKLLQAWKWAAFESKRKKEVADTKENLEAYEKEWLERDQQRKRIVEMGWAYTMREVHDNPYWFLSDKQVDSQKASKLRDEFVQKEGLREKMLLHWWQAHDQANCAVCKRYTQAQLAAASGNPKQLQRRKSF